jgi:mono/diheme cytochrome c family protein
MDPGDRNASGTLMKTMKLLIIVALIAISGVAAFIYSGIFNIAADDPHWPVTFKILTTVRDRSVKARSAVLTPPDLSSEARVKLGAGNYDAMCTGCHLGPGMEESELSLGLYPNPPSWRDLGKIDSRQAFWAIKHGIKMSGMPAWGKSMGDGHIWNIVAFVQKLPHLTPDSYHELVASSGGHKHDNDEAEPHFHSEM